MEYHINAKEPLAAKFFLKTFIKVSGAHVKLLSDNTAAVHDINKMHSNKSEFSHSRTMMQRTMIQMQNHAQKKVN